MTETRRTLADIERDLGPLAREEQAWLLGRLSVTAPAALAEALSALAQRRRPDAVPTVRGGPALDPQTEFEYIRERET